MNAVRQSFMFNKQRRRQLGWFIASFFLITFYQNCEGTLTTQGDQSSTSDQSGASISPPGSSAQNGQVSQPSTQPSAQPTGQPPAAPGTVSPEEALRIEAARVAACKALMGKPSFTTTSDQAVTIVSGAGAGAGDLNAPTLTMSVDRAVAATIDPKQSPKTLAETLPCEFTTNVTCNLVTGDPSRPSTLLKAIDDGGEDVSVTATTMAQKELILRGAFSLGNGACSGQVNRATQSKDIKLSNLRNNNNGTLYRCVEGEAWVSMTARTQLNNMNVSPVSDPVYMKVTFKNGCWDESRLAPGPDPLPSKAQFGGSVAIDGDWAAAIATQDNSGAILTTGSFSLFHKVAGQWTLTQKIVLAGAVTGDRLTSIALKGTKLAVSSSLRGRTGVVGIYSLNSTTQLWELTQIISPNDAQLDQEFGASLALTESALAVGSPSFSVSGPAARDRSGQVYVFSCGPTTCTFSYSRNVVEQDRGFGSSVAISGNILAVGAPQAITREGGGKGFVNLYNLSTGALTKTIAPDDGDLGMRFGDSLTLLGTKLAVGAPFRNDVRNPAAPLDSAGGVYFYTDIAGSTSKPSHLLIGAVAGGNLGRSVALSADALFSGCPRCANRGGAVFYHKLSTLPVSNTAGTTANFTSFGLNRVSGDEYGNSIAVSGSNVIVGAFNKTAPTDDAGAVYIQAIK